MKNKQKTSKKQATFRIISSCLTVCWEKVDGILHPSSILISSESITNLANQQSNDVFWFWWDSFFSNSIKLISHDISQFPLLETSSFLLLQTSLFINLSSLSFDLFELCSYSLESFITFHRVSEFLVFFAIFPILWMLAIVNMAKFSLWKTLITLVKSWLCLGLNFGYHV